MRNPTDPTRPRAAKKKTAARGRLPLLDVYRHLFKCLGPQHWWPGDTRVEIIAGAILTQNTAWTNVEKAIRRLKENRALNLEKLHAAGLDTLASWIRPAGYFNIKARRLRAFTEMVHRNFDGRLPRMFARPTEELRRILIEVNGIGPETADSILLYAGGRPVFVVDAYTRRILERHGWLAPRASYDDVARLFTNCLPRDVQLYNEYHALLVMVGKDYCRRKPKCSICPLNRWPPEGKRP